MGRKMGDALPTRAPWEGTPGGSSGSLPFIGRPSRFGWLRASGAACLQSTGRKERSFYGPVGELPRTESSKD